MVDVQESATVDFLANAFVHLFAFPFENNEHPGGM